MEKQEARSCQCLRFQSAHNDQLTGKACGEFPEEVLPLNA
jgi:hypothetical protein